jgi:hypothetical protein
VRMERMENSGRWKRGRRSVLRQINRNLSR